MMNDSAAGSQTATALYNVIKDQSVEAVLPVLPLVVQIDSLQEPINAASLLWQHNLLAVPVYSSKQQEYIGFFDMRDILRAVLNSQERRRNSSISSEASLATSNDDEGEEQDKNMKASDDGGDNATTPDEEQEEIIRHTVQELSLNGRKKVTLESLAARRPAYCCRPDDSLEHLCKLLSQSDCRRVLIRDNDNNNDGTCSDMVSRSTLIKYLASHASSSSNSALNNETLKEAGLDYAKDVVSVLQDATAKEAFELIINKRLYGIAVVDEDGCLVGNTSARDIKLVALYNNGTTSAFDLDILSFLAAVRQEDSPTLTGMKAKFPRCHVKESSSVNHVLQLLAKTGYHRVFVTNEYLQVVGVISEQDILRFLLNKGKIQLAHVLSDVAE